ncbi:MAG: hypothetical protein ACTSRZ_16940, partial [Promethearchaeota archaeon]
SDFNINRISSTKNDNSYKKTNLSNAETFYNFKVNTYFNDQEKSAEDIFNGIHSLFQKYLEAKANTEKKEEINTVNMSIAFMKGNGEKVGGEELFPLYMALATYTKFFQDKTNGNEPKLPIYVIFLSRIITSVEIKKSIEETEVTFFPQEKKQEEKKQEEKKQENAKKIASRVSIFNTYKTPEETNEYVIKLVEFNKEDMDNYKENLKSFKTRLEEKCNRNLRAFKLILNFNDVENLLEKGKINNIGAPFDYPVQNIDKTYDDIPINEQAGIFIGVNIIEDIFRKIEQREPYKEGESTSAYFLQLGLDNYRLNVIKVRNKESEEEKQEDKEKEKETEKDERQISAEWTKSDADYESKDIVVEIKSREPNKISGGTIGSWIVNSLAKAEKQVAISLARHPKKRNVGFVVSLFNLKKLSRDVLKKGIVKKGDLSEEDLKTPYLIVEALIYNEKVVKEKKGEKKE